MGSFVKMLNDYNIWYVLFRFQGISWHRMAATDIVCCPILA